MFQEEQCKVLDAGADGAFPSHPYAKDVAEGRFGK